MTKDYLTPEQMHALVPGKKVNLSTRELLENYRSPRELYEEDNKRKEHLKFLQETNHILDDGLFYIMDQLKVMEQKYKDRFHTIFTICRKHRDMDLLDKINNAYEETLQYIKDNTGGN